MAASSVNLPASSLLADLVSCFVANVALRGAACTLNDMCDVEFDRQVGT
jgi:4-hydroxybenzoate polyprenyltransferase